MYTALPPTITTTTNLPLPPLLAHLHQVQYSTINLDSIKQSSKWRSEFMVVLHLLISGLVAEVPQDHRPTTDCYRH